MRIIFIHQNMPGQFGRLASALAAEPGNEVAFVTRRTDRELPNVMRVSYELRTPVQRPEAPIGSTLFTQSLFGEAVLQACRALLLRGFKPDVIVGHPGWGELLFVKDLLPDVPLVSYCEFYHAPLAPYFAGDPPRPLSLKESVQRRAESAHLLLSLEAADCGWSPTNWQKSVHPTAYHKKIQVIFDGIDSDVLRPDPAAAFELPNGALIHHGDEVVTYAARSLEPTRGFPTFLRALPTLLSRRPQLQVLIAGGEAPHYDAPPEGSRTWAEHFRKTTPLDSARVHFLGPLSPERFRNLLQVSKAHIYLTTPTVLSWSAIEAMSVGCNLIASRSPPTLEIIEDGVNGILFEFDDPQSLSDAAERGLAVGADHLGAKAREMVGGTYSLRKCLPAQLNLLRCIAKREMSS